MELKVIFFYLVTLLSILLQPPMLHPNLTLHEVYVLQEDGGLRCKVAGFLTEYYTNIRERTKWKEQCVSVQS